MKFAAACKKFFGLQEGQTLTSFVAELKLLTDADKAELAGQLGQVLGETVETV